MDQVHQTADKPCRIAIIGGGFSGAAVALNLLHKLPREVAHITIIEPRATLGAGLAYSAPDPAHRVNVAASGLLVLPEEPGAFDAWLRRSGALDEDPAALLEDGRAFPRRSVFGNYMNDIVRGKAAAHDVPTMVHAQALATAIVRNNDGYRIGLDGGAVVDADVVVLAVSNPPPAVPKPVQPLIGNEKFVHDPWRKGALANIRNADRVLIIGTALSTADAVATLDAQGHAAEIIAISRRGLVSRTRVVAHPEPFGDFSTEPSRTALALLRRVREAVREAESSGSSWEAVVESLRAQGPAVWAALPPAEKRRFLHHVRPYWDVHRHRLAPQLERIFASKSARGQLRTVAARIMAATPTPDGFRVDLRHRRTGETVAERFDAIVNCTGPNHARVVQTNAALASLAEAGLVRPDPYGLGLDTDGETHAVDRDGNPVPTLFVSGPLARASLGELTGLPQISHHAALVATQVAALALSRQAVYAV